MFTLNPFCGAVTVYMFGLRTARVQYCTEIVMSNQKGHARSNFVIVDLWICVLLQLLYLHLLLTNGSRALGFHVLEIVCMLYKWHPQFVFKLIPVHDRIAWSVALSAVFQVLKAIWDRFNVINKNVCYILQIWKSGDFIIRTHFS